MHSFSETPCDLENDVLFFVAGTKKIVQQHQRQRNALPNIHPFYAVKCPPDPKLLQLLADMDVSFYCASLAKIEQLENPSWAGVAPADLCVRSYRHIARRTQKDTTTKRPDMLYLNDGLYGRFSMKWSEDKIFVSTLIEPRGTSTLAPREWKPHRYSIWVPTCDSNDCISKEVVMDQEMMIAD